jgi:hypothetical protein
MQRVRDPVRALRACVWALDGLGFLVSYCTSQEGGGSRPTGVTATALGVALGQPERLPVSPVSAPCAVGSL